jgi:non-specific serine/threonine protein kinase
VRRLGRFELREMVGRSQRTMAWRVHDPRVDQELLLVLPRVALPNDDAVRAWEAHTRRVSRLGHPGIAHAVEVGAQDRFPYVAYDFEAASWGRRVATGALPPREAAAAIAQAARVLGFVHDAGCFHGDLQPYFIFISPSGQVKLAGLEVATLPPPESMTPAEVEALRATQVEAGARADVLALGVLLHSALAGRNPMDEADVGIVVSRMMAGEAESLRLPSSVPQPVADPLRAISARAVDRDPGMRYRSARALHTALEGWLKADPNAGDGTFKSVIDRVRAEGLLPASEETRERMANLRMLEGESTREMSELLLGDLAVALELLRVVNTAQQRDSRRAGSASILTLHRAVALLGLEGVRRSALALKPWPGPLRGASVDQLAALLERCRQAARVARQLRPQGYDAEAVYMATVLQNLGRIVLQYHLPEQAQQIRGLMFPQGTASEADSVAGLSEETAAFSVLGVDIASVGIAVGRHLGLDVATLTALKRIPARGGVLAPPRSDEEALCQSASCANDAIDALQLPPEKAAAELAAIVNRYGRGLRITVKSLRDALVPNGLTQAVARVWLKSTPGLLVDEDDDW